MTLRFIEKVDAHDLLTIGLVPNMHQLLIIGHVCLDILVVEDIFDLAGNSLDRIRAREFVATF